MLLPELAEDGRAEAAGEVVGVGAVVADGFDEAVQSVVEVAGDSAPCTFDHQVAGGSFGEGGGLEAIR